MHDTWKEWHTAYMETKIGLALQGFKVNDWIVDIGGLQAYCKSKGIKNDGAARSQFVQAKTPLWHL